MDTSDPQRNPPSLLPDERAALRAYLQRTEVRLSTLHRVAGLFVSGAGLLVLIPTIFQNGVLDILEKNLFYLMKSVENIQLASQHSALLFRPLLWLGEIAIFIAILSIPSYAIYTLIKDLVLFYFESSIPGYHLTIPRFSIPALALAPDELSDRKASVYRAQYAAAYSTPNLTEETDFKDIILKSSIKQILDRMSKGSETQPAPLRESEPVTRTWPSLEPILKGETSEPFSKVQSDVEHLNTAFDIAGLLDLDLRDDVARTEILMTKKIVLLRGIVLRYFKALIAILITTISLMIGNRILHVINTNYDNTVSEIVVEKLTFIFSNCISLITLMLLYYAVRTPTKWIYHQFADVSNTPRISIDSKISRFEKFASSVSRRFGILACLLFISAFFLY